MMRLEVVVIIIRADDGSFFCHQRRDDKETFPGRYGLGAGGRIERGEGPTEAAKRELREETGLTTSLRPLFEIHYDGEGTRRNLHVFETIVKRRLITTDNGEWQWSGWLRKNEVDELVAGGRLCPDTALLYRRYEDDSNS